MDCIQTDGLRESAVAWYTDITAICQYSGMKGLTAFKTAFSRLRNLSLGLLTYRKIK